MSNCFFLLGGGGRELHILYQFVLEFDDRVCQKKVVDHVIYLNRHALVTHTSKMN